jgi:cytoskeletal protein CcmA (bactofilin family)
MARRIKSPAHALSPGAPWTLIGPGSAIHGEMLMAGNVLLHGRIEGILFTDGEVRVAPEGLLEGGIHARRIVVEGACEGRLEATEEVRLLPGSIVRGDIETRILLVEDGARFLGNWIRGGGSGEPRVLAAEPPTPGRA